MRGVVIILALLAIVVFVILKRRNGTAPGKPEGLPYVPGEGLFSAAERSFLGVLDQAVDGHFRVFAKVRVADVLSIAIGTPKSLRQKAFNQISGKHFDFVLCRLGDLKPVCAIELNDKSHEQAERKGRDKFLEDACAAAGFPLIFLPAQSGYALTDVRSAISAVLGSAAMPDESLSKTPEGAAIAPSPVSVQPESVGVSAQPVCPRCSSPMARRVAKSGENAGKEFWGCTKFPACRGVVLS
ncbi:MAG: topoisomerase [Proteobacteria bacterium]|nr:topoisomerase [Pseudomonadota bacterium]